MEEEREWPVQGIVAEEKERLFDDETLFEDIFYKGLATPKEKAMEIEAALPQVSVSREEWPSLYGSRSERKFIGGSKNEKQQRKRRQRTTKEDCLKENPINEAKEDDESPCADDEAEEEEEEEEEDYDGIPIEVTPPGRRFHHHHHHHRRQHAHTQRNASTTHEQKSVKHRGRSSARRHDYIITTRRPEEQRLAAQRRLERNIRAEKRSFKYGTQIDELANVLEAAGCPASKCNKSSILSGVMSYISALEAQLTVIDDERRTVAARVCQLAARQTASQEFSSEKASTKLDFPKLFLQASLPLALASVDGKILTSSKRFDQLYQALGRERVQCAVTDDDQLHSLKTNKNEDENNFCSGSSSNGSSSNVSSIYQKSLPAVTTSASSGSSSSSASSSGSSGDDAKRQASRYTDDTEFSSFSSSSKSRDPVIERHKNQSAPRTFFDLAEPPMLQHIFSCVGDLLRSNDPVPYATIAQATSCGSTMALTFIRPDNFLVAILEAPETATRYHDTFLTLAAEDSQDHDDLATTQTASDEMHDTESPDNDDSLQTALIHSQQTNAARNGNDFALLETIEIIHHHEHNNHREHQGDDDNQLEGLEEEQNEIDEDEDVFDIPHRVVG